MSDLSCFKAYDIRDEIGVNIDQDIVYRIGRAVAQHFSAKSVVIGFDARETSPAYAAAASRGAHDAGADVVNIGLAGIEEMYWAVTEFGACAGIEVRASHNPINYNGMKIVKSQSRPLDDVADFQMIKSLAGYQEWLSCAEVGKELDSSREKRKDYVDRVLSFVDVTALRSLKIVVNCGNGAAGPTFDAIAVRLLELRAPLEFILVHHTPDATFPNGIPNPLLPENHSATADRCAGGRASLPPAAAMTPGVPYAKGRTRTFRLKEFPVDKRRQLHQLMAHIDHVSQARTQDIALFRAAGFRLHRSIRNCSVPAQNLPNSVSQRNQKDDFKKQNQHVASCSGRTK